MDSGWKHTTNATKQAQKKQHIKYMEDPSKSPDLSPVEQSMEGSWSQET